MRAATAPLTLMKAVTTATRRETTTSTGTRRVPARRVTWLPAQAVTPVASSASLTTKSEAMKRTTGSPKPASACCRSSTPVAHRLTATPTATTLSGTRPDTKATMAARRMSRVAVIARARLSDPRWTRSCYGSVTPGGRRRTAAAPRERRRSGATALRDGLGRPPRPSRCLAGVSRGGRRPRPGACPARPRGPWSTRSTGRPTPGGRRPAAGAPRRAGPAPPAG